MGKKTWDAGVGTSEVLSRRQDGEPEVAEVVRELRLSDKGKGKEKEVVEETLQEDVEQQEM